MSAPVRTVPAAMPEFKTERFGSLLHLHVHVDSGDWARVVLDEAPRTLNGGGGGMITVCSSFDNYGTVFSAPGDDFVGFLLGCDVGYLENRFRPGKDGKITKDQRRELAGFLRIMWPAIRVALLEFVKSRHLETYADGAK